MNTRAEIVLHIVIRYLRGCSGKQYVLSLFCVFLFGYSQPTALYAESEKPKLQSIRIEGNRVYTPSQIKEWVGVREGNAWDMNSWKKVLATLVQRYHQDGYLMVDIKDSTIVSQDQKAHVSLFITEGPQVKVGKISLEGNQTFGDRQLFDRMELYEGAIFRKKALDRDIAQIIQFYEKRGYPFCSVAPADFSLSADGKVSFTFRIDKGPTVRIDSVRVIGNQVTKRDVIIRELRIREGALYNQELVDAAYRRLMQLNFFQKVAPLDISYDHQSGKGILIVSIEEGPINLIDGIVGYVPGSIDRKSYFTGFVEASFRNLLGTGRLFEARWQRKDPQISELDLRYEEPWFFKLPFNVGGTLGQSQKIGYTRTDLGLSVSYSVYENLTSKLQLNLEKIIPDSLGAYELPRSRILNGRIELQYDLRDDVLNPKGGILYSIASELGFKRASPSVSFKPEKSNVTRTKYFITLLHFLNFRYRQVLAIGLNGAEVKTNERFLPTDEKLWLGGTKSLRGYQEEQFMGDRIAWINLEHRYLVSARSRIFYFLDIGYYHDRRAGRQNQAENVNEVKYSYGVGLRLESKAGILGLDYGLGEKDRPSQGKIHLSLLNRF